MEYSFGRNCASNPAQMLQIRSKILNEKIKNNKKAYKGRYENNLKAMGPIKVKYNLMTKNFYKNVDVNVLYN